MRLYESLKAQTCKQFVWVLVDDGSTDATPEAIKCILQESAIAVTALRQDNQGKHIAHNLGASVCNTEYFVCVDSDDVLVPDAIERINAFCIANRELTRDDIAGIIAWKGWTATEKIGDYPSSLEPCSLRALYQEYHMTGDTMLIFKTSVIQQYPFPAIKGEKFLRESIIYNQIDDNYKYLILNQILYIAQYYEDGLSRNASKLELKSPKGAAMFRWDEYAHGKTNKEKVRNLIGYVFFNRIARNNKESLKRLGVFFVPLWLASWSGFYHYRRYLKK